MPKKSKLKLEEFIYQVKEELLDAQKVHEGEPAYFQLEHVDLEVKVAAGYTDEGKLSVWVLEAGTNVKEETTQTVKLSFGVAPIRLTNDEDSDREGSEGKKEASGAGGYISHRGIYYSPK